MTLLTPLGLLGLLGVVALIIIYIIKPNYQQKYISSTFVWKLSLQYRKKRIPISKLRNLLLILCQILFLTICAIILTHPNTVIKTKIKEPEVIAIIDASASMRTSIDGESRFVRAVESAMQLSADTWDDHGYVSVIFADDTPDYLLEQRVTEENRTALEMEMENLLYEDTLCTFATSDINGAIDQCEKVIKQNPDAKIYLYTDQNYAYIPQEIQLVNVSDDAEWNCAILNAVSRYEENYYTFIVDVACYGEVDYRFDVIIDVYGVNTQDSQQQGDTVTFEQNVSCIGGEPSKVIFVNEEFYSANPELYDSMYGESIYKIPKEKRIYAYQSIHVSIQDESGIALQDSLLEDNTFDIYGGMKPVIKIQYASEKPNSFWPAALRQLRNVFDDRWDIQITEVKKGNEPATSGFDFYVFEHKMPNKTPVDGVLLLVNPDKVSTSLGAVMAGEAYSGNPTGENLEIADNHSILNNVLVNEITVTRYKRIIFSEEYKTLMINPMTNSAMLAVRDDDVKVAIMAFSLHYSNLAVTLNFPVMLYNLFQYYFPVTVQGNAFEVNEIVELNAIGETLKVTGYDFEQEFNSFPAYLKLSAPGTYTMEQQMLSDEKLTEKIYVRIPLAESNIRLQGESIVEPYKINSNEDFLEDILLYLAIAIVALMFFERLLRNSKNA